MGINRGKSRGDRIEGCPRGKGEVAFEKSCSAEKDFDNVYRGTMKRRRENYFLRTRKESLKVLMFKRRKSRFFHFEIDISYTSFLGNEIRYCKPREKVLAFQVRIGDRLRNSRELRS